MTGYLGQHWPEEDEMKVTPIVEDSSTIESIEVYPHGQGGFGYEVGRNGVKSIVAYDESHRGSLKVPFLAVYLDGGHLTSRIPALYCVIQYKKPEEKPCKTSNTSG